VAGGSGGAAAALEGAEGESRGGAGAGGVVVGAMAAALHFAGALKSLPGLAALPVDLTAAAAAALLPCSLLLAASRRWRVDAALAFPLAGCALLPLWLVVAGSWSVSAAVLAEKLPQAALLGPAMLLAGALVGADRAARRGFCAAAIGIGLGVGGAVAWGVATDAVVLGGAPGADPAARARVQYQIAGLAVACAAALAALRLVEARGAAARLCWGVAALALAAAALVPGGRAALLGLGLAVAAAPALRLWLAGRRGAAALWVGATGAAGLGGPAAAC
jgi:hypothetical protein